MRNFYFTTKVGRALDLNFLKENFKELVWGDKKSFDLYLYSNEEPRSFHKEGSDFIVALGSLIYKNRIGREAVKSFYDDLKLYDLKTLLLSDHIHGQFCILLYRDNQVKIVTDKIGYLALYAYNRNNNVEISNSFLVVAKNNETTISNVGVGQYISENVAGHACCNKNIVEEVEYLEGGNIYCVVNGKMESEKYYDLKDDLKIGKYDDPDEIAFLETRAILDNLAFLPSIKEEVFADLTGGVDTRANLAHLLEMKACHRTGVQIPVEYEHYTNTGQYSEYAIIKQISERFDLDLHIYGDKSFLEDIDHIKNTAFYFTNKQTYNRRTGYFLDLRQKDIGILISGLTGTELHRQPYIEYFDNNQQLDLNDFAPQYYPLIDVFNENFLKEDEFFQETIRFIGRGIDGLDYDLAEDLGAYIDYIAFFRTHFCRYFGLASSIVPFYTTYGDFSVVKLLMQTTHKAKKRFSIQRRILTRLNKDLSSMDCTRGFPLTMVNEQNFHRFGNMIDNNIPQQYITDETMKEEREVKEKIKYYFQNTKEFYEEFRDKYSPRQNEESNLLHSPTDFSIIPALENFLKQEEPVFEFVSKNKLEHIVKRDCNFNILNRVDNLNQMLKFIGHG